MKSASRYVVQMKVEKGRTNILVRWLSKKIVTRWIKAPNVAHVFFRCLSNILEGGARATTPGAG